MTGPRREGIRRVIARRTPPAEAIRDGAAGLSGGVRPAPAAHHVRRSRAPGPSGRSSRSGATNPAHNRGTAPVRSGRDVLRTRLRVTAILPGGRGRDDEVRLFWSESCFRELKVAGHIEEAAPKSACAAPLQSPTARSGLPVRAESAAVALRIGMSHGCSRTDPRSDGPEAGSRLHQPARSPGRRDPQADAIPKPGRPRSRAPSRGGLSPRSHPSWIAPETACRRACPTPASEICNRTSPCLTAGWCLGLGAACGRCHGPAGNRVVRPAPVEPAGDAGGAAARRLTADPRPRTGRRIR
ncbi:hypothetical protein SAMN02799643_00147 [Methylobacterium sp. UNCCL125]|nr:hypothetical protein SAMN02799643_00147 [Methylobacterium sp. UNCCL125]